MLPEIEGLQSYWSRKAGRAPPDSGLWMADKILLDMLGLGIEQTQGWLARTRPDFDAFEAWIVATAGPPEPEKLDRYTAWREGRPAPPATVALLAGIDAAEPVLAADDLAHWESEGFVILKGAISPGEAEAAARALWTHVGAQPDLPDSWYAPNPHGIMVQLFQNPALEPARRSARIHKAFAQVWGTADLWTTTDRMSFNSPLRAGDSFPGPGLHWDVSLVTPIPFATQAILYLSDTDAEQGALTLVPGFHRRVEAWLAGLPANADPRRQDLSAEARAIAASAGDLIIWRQDLPHGASPNVSARPRLSQYVNMYSSLRERQPVWR